MYAKWKTPLITRSLPVLLSYIVYMASKGEFKQLKELKKKDVIFLLSLTGLFSSLFLLHIALLKHVEMGSSWVKHLWIFMFPFPATAITSTVVLPGPVSFPYVVFLSILFSVVTGMDPWVMLYVLLGCLMASHTVRDCRKRSSLLYAGLTSGLTNSAVIMLKLMPHGHFMGKMALEALASGVMSGGIGGMLSMGIVPLSELVFGYTTNLSLLELGTLDHPLLKELAIRAPGTYYHSMLVSTLSEMAAESVGANPLLAKVGAYFHDIGKLKKPEYFVENQGLVNRHSKLSPHMSALILKSHVKDGVELAKRYRLGEKIADIIQQHHGTSLIAFFYKKALDMGEDVDEREFRYPGPKPKTKEAAIIMMADSVEAASRTLTEPTPARIKGLVLNIINNLFKDGQLEECDLTFKELATIGSVFTRVLTGIHHKRIEYPEPEGAKGEKNEGRAVGGGSKITPFPGGTKLNGEHSKGKDLWKGRKA